jgi:hypothetical protein
MRVVVATRGGIDRSLRGPPAHASGSPPDEQSAEGVEEDLPLICGERSPDRVARMRAGVRHPARGGTAPSWLRCMACLRCVISFDQANRPVTRGPIRRRREGPSLPERVTQELHSVADFWKGL